MNYFIVANSLTKVKFSLSRFFKFFNVIVDLSGQQMMKRGIKPSQLLGEHSSVNASNIEDG